ncbi:HAMP domain-containing sensor histidine kinase [Sphingosinicella microcystinivorans]|uniref:histidine kinase n=1 Tax=Sphingosinicella microcystinivorans TaxID=335406 RepID=A0AAD1D450_SPHMI|nr:ATP-binding protein [Sphingosinicella microcystinivorans]RKS84946.1 two-component system OmpR family sensor kinase [Sphingosinicella microcystinivorans]BBE33395.1 sensor histidine kinase [Sphingosinicella microcystinivorans]
MKRRLFWKIWLGFWAAYLLLTTGLWSYWSFQPAPFRPDWDPPHAAGTALVETAATALDRDGPSGLAQQVANWPGFYRERLTIAPLSTDSCAPTGDPRVITRQSHGYCLRYATPPLSDADEDWMSTVAPPDYLIAIALAGLVFSAALAAYLSSPIHRLQLGFDRLAQGDLSVRLGPTMGRRKDEVADLARDFDAMAERLQELVGARDRLLHDVSHELRSPLARMRLAADLLRRDPGRLDASLDRIDREAGQLDALVGELLTLARLESDAGRSEEYFDLLEVLRLVTDDAQFEAEAQGVTLNVDLPTDGADDDWLVLGSGQLVHRAFENILRNALRFSSQGFAVGLRLERDGADCCIVTVDDEGPGIADGEATRLLEPFVQGAHQSGTGFGLGLGIARRAIAASGGSVALANRAGGGLRVTIALPLARGALNQPKF